ncbi:hypothetical protein CPC08DRAFT_707896 [Agrocybe pediades]|nr:hypothetical protein CPC08DRAFT_707896 [Agrocybe pediades]
MKARVKDTVGRQQKTFFGHRRLDLLSQGLSASKTSGKPQLPSISLSSNRGRPDIDLAHARQKIPLEEDADVYSYIPKAVHISPSTPDSRRRLKTTHTSSFHGPRSKVLDAVDGVIHSVVSEEDLG